MSLFRSIIKSAINCDLKKTEYKALLILLHQTLGYGKTTDAISWTQMEKLTGVRRDHLKPPCQELVDMGFFDREEHSTFDYTYSIGSDFLTDHSDSFFTPSLPKVGKELTESWGETNQVSVTNTSLNTTSLNFTQPQQAEVAEEPKQTETDAVCGGDDFELPKEIEEKDHATCRKILAKLTPEQRFQTIEVFCSKAAQGGIKSAPAYLSSLSKCAIDGTLTPVVTVDTTTPLHASHIPAGQQITSAQEEDNDRSSQLAYLQQQVNLYGEDLAHWADVFGMQNVIEGRV